MSRKLINEAENLWQCVSPRAERGGLFLNDEIPRLASLVRNDTI